MINSDYLDNLNKAQKEAVLHLDGPLLIVAGAGSGKTKVLTSRIAHIIKEKKAFPNQILSVTFTNKAEEVVSVAVRESSLQREQIQRIISTALDAGVNVEDVTRFATMGGATVDEITAGVNSAPSQQDKQQNPQH